MLHKICKEFENTNLQNQRLVNRKRFKLLGSDRKSQTGRKYLI